MLLKYIIIVKFFRPELKPIEKEVDVVLKFPDTDPLSPPILHLNEIAFKYSPEKVIFSCVNLGANLESRICIVSIICSITKINHSKNLIYAVSKSIKRAMENVVFDFLKSYK